MENNQTTQQSSESSDSKLAQSSHPFRKPARFNSLFALLNRHPWLVWTGVWGLLLAVTVVAIFSLTHTGRVEQEDPEPTGVTTQIPVETSSQTGNPLYIWLLGAVALSCAVGSLAIYKRLNNSPRPRQLRKRSSAQVPTRRQQRQQRLRESLPPVPTPVESSPPVEPEPVPAEAKPVVTVLPPEESHPLDAGEEPLAEMMDIRKQRSLSSFLRDH